MDSNHKEPNGEHTEYRCNGYRCMVHVIRPGDTLYRLSRQYGVKVSALMMANPFVDIYNLRVGDELCIPRLLRSEPRKEETTVQEVHCDENQTVVQAELLELPESDVYSGGKDNFPEHTDYYGINRGEADDTYGRNHTV